MRRLFLVAASVTPLLLAAGLPAAAQPHFGGHGFRHGGFQPRGIGMRPFGVRPAFPAYRQGWYGGGWRRGGYYRYGGYPYWGSGLAAAATFGAIAGYPYYEPIYPAYPVYPVYGAVPTATGGMCSTPVKTCALYDPAPLGVGCSCRVPGGRARGVVVGP